MKNQPPSTKQNFVYTVLKEQILSGQLKPGAPLVNSEIGAQLSVSSIPVREAIQRLRAEGLVDSQPHRSAIVSRLLRKDLEEYLYIRAALEVVATRSAVPNITSQLIQKLRNICEKEQEAFENDQLNVVGKYNKEFHLLIYSASPYKMLYQMIIDLWANTDRHRARSIFMVVNGIAEKSCRDHCEILNTIEQGDAEGAARLMDKHKRYAISTFLQTLQEEEEMSYMP